MIPEERAETALDACYAAHNRTDRVMAIAAVIREAENDALERAAEFFEHGDVTFAADIRALKHGDPA